MKRKPGPLFLCTHNAACSQMAEALLPNPRATGGMYTSSSTASSMVMPASNVRLAPNPSCALDSALAATVVVVRGI